MTGLSGGPSEVSVYAVGSCPRCVLVSSSLILAEARLFAERSEFSAHRCTEGPEPPNGCRRVEQDADTEQNVARCGDCAADLDAGCSDTERTEPREEHSEAEAVWILVPVEAGPDKLAHGF